MRQRLSYANVMSTLALFIALAGGTAVAATALPRNSVGTMHLKQNAVTSAKVKDSSIRRADVVAGEVQLRVGENCPEDQAIRAIDVKGGVVCEVDDRGGGPGGGPPSGSAGGDLAGSYPNPSLRNGAVTSASVADRSLTGADIANETLTGDKIAMDALSGREINEAALGRVPSALLGGLGRSGATTRCAPPTPTFAFCAATEIINVPPGARALVFGRTLAFSVDGYDDSRGSCRLTTSSTGVVPNTVQNFQVDSEIGDTEHATLVGVTGPLPSGATSFAIECNMTKGLIGYLDISASVVLISGA